MKKLFVVLILFINFFNLNGQTTLTGRIEDEEARPLPFANALLLHTTDSTLVKGEITDEQGRYFLTDVPEGSYVLSASLIGYIQNYSSSFTINKDSPEEIVLPVLVLMQDVQQLGEVEIVTRRPFIEKEVDRTIVNVANSIVAGGNSALEVLEKAPGVRIDRQSESISMLGKEGVIVQINGKRTYLSMQDIVRLLTSTSSDNIDSIELITNPSARYDAEGNAGIINIKMKKNIKLGTNGTVSLAVGSGRYDRENATVQLNHRSLKFNAFGSYGFSRGGNYYDFDMFRAQEAGEGRNIIEQEMYVRLRTKGHNAKAGIDYFLGRNTTIGLLWSAIWNDRTDRIPRAATTFRRQVSGAAYLRTLSEIENFDTSTNQLANLNFNHSFGNYAGNLTADIDFGQFKREAGTSLITSTVNSEEPSIPAQSIETFMPVKIDIFSFSVNYSRSLWKDWKAEVGMKYSDVQSDNDLTLRSGSPGDLEMDPELSNHFVYEEKINAAYVMLSGSPFDKTEVQLGLRAERTSSVGNSVSMGEKVERDYLDLFPSLFVSRELSEKQDISFSYSYRIDRPNYQQLNPARWYLDPYAYELGNPFLNPQYTHSLELQHGFNDKIFTSLGANFIEDLSTKLVVPVDDRVAVRIPQNVGHSQNYSLNVNFPLKVTNFWELQTNLLGLYKRTQFTFQDIPLEVEQLSGTFNVDNSLLLGNDWRAEISGWLRTPVVDAMFRSPWIGALNAGIQKTFSAKWKARINIQDIFRTNKYIQLGEAAGFVQNHSIGFDSRVVMLSVSYSFGNQKMEHIRQRKSGAEEEIERTN